LNIATNMMRKLYWYLTAYFHKHGLIVFSSLIIGLLIFWFFIPSLANLVEIRNRYYIGVIGEFDLSSLPDLITHQLSVGLTQINEDGSVSPALAERWSVEQDNTTYRFLLKDGLVWQDGQPLSPNDIHYSFPEVETILNPHDIVFKLPAPFSPFPTNVSQPIFREAKTQNHFISKPTLIGIGEYSIIDYTKKGNRLTELIVEGKGERFIYRFYLTEDDVVTAFKRGEVDIIPDLVRQHDIYEWPTTIVESTLDKHRYLAVFFNTKHPLLSKNVRQALSYALVKKEGEERAVGPISPNSWAYLPGGKTYNLDWERGSERLRDEIPREPLKFELTTTTLFADKAEVIKKQWEEFGQKVATDCLNDVDITDKSLCENVKIDVSIRVSNFPDLNNFQLLLIGQEIPPDPDQYSIWHSDQSTNFTGYKNTRIDNLLEKGRQEIDQQNRIEIYQEFQQFFLEDPPAIFLEYIWTNQVRRKTTPSLSLNPY